MLVTSPASDGLIIRWVVRSAPSPLTAGMIDHRTLSPTWIEFTTSPGCNATSQTSSGEQTTDGRDSPNVHRKTPSAPRAGRSKWSRQRRAITDEARSFALSFADGDRRVTGGGLPAGTITRWPPTCAAADAAAGEALAAA